MTFECGDCRQQFATDAAADEHEMRIPGHLTFYAGQIPPGYIPDTFDSDILKEDPA